MTYRRHGQALGALGQATAPGLRPFDQLTKEGVRYDLMWGLVDSDQDLQAMRDRLVVLKAMMPADAVRDPDGRLREESPFLSGLLSFWTRASGNKALWPGWQCGDTRCFNFGPNNGDSRQVRINEAMWNLLGQANTQEPWTATDRGFVLVRQSDPLLANYIRARLLAGGYISAADDVSVQDGSAFSLGLLRFYSDAREQGVPVGAWAGMSASGGCPTHTFPDGSCYNFGPHTATESSGHMIRLSPDLLNVLVNTTVQPRLALASQAVAGALKRTTTRPALFGSAVPGAVAPIPVQRLAISKSLPLNTGALATLRSALTKVS